MTLTLDPQTEQEFTAAAAESGVSAEAALTKAVKLWTAQRKTATSQSEAETRHAAVYAALGCLAGQGMSVDELLTERHAIAESEAANDSGRAS